MVPIIGQFAAGKKEVDHCLDFRLSAEAPRVEKDTEISSS